MFQNPLHLPCLISYHPINPGITGRSRVRKDTPFWAQFSLGLPETGSRLPRFAWEVSTARKNINIQGYFPKISNLIGI